MVYVWIMNEVDEDVRIREGNAGVYVTNTKIKKKKCTILTVDPNATYKEYIFTVDSTNLSIGLPFTIDDALEYSVVTVVLTEKTKEYAWEVARKRSKDNLLQRFYGNLMALFWT